MGSGGWRRNAPAPLLSALARRCRRDRMSAAALMLLEFAVGGQIGRRRRRYGSKDARGIDARRTGR